MSAINWIIAILVFFITTGLLLSKDWRWVFGLLAAQYIAVAWLTFVSWSLPLAMVKLITGWTVCIILGMSQPALSRSSTFENGMSQSRFFRIVAAALFGLLSLALALRSAAWLGIDPSIIWGSFILMTLGLLHAGLSFQPMRLIISLLTLFSGFEILYASVENSLMVAILLSAVTLGLSLVGAYMINRYKEGTRE